MVQSSNLVSALACGVKELSTDDLHTCGFIVRQEIERRLARAERLLGEGSVPPAQTADDGETVDLLTLKITDAVRAGQ